MELTSYSLLLYLVLGIFIFCYFVGTWVWIKVDKKSLEESNLNADLPTSTMEEILKEIKEDLASDTIRQQIDEEFANEKLNEQFKKEWNTEEEVFEDIKDSQENRDKLI